jgi:hypothetical protein
LDVSTTSSEVIDVILKECERVELTSTLLLLLGSGCSSSEESGEIARVLELKTAASAGTGQSGRGED